jgi:hypothetical protein
MRKLIRMDAATKQGGRWDEPNVMFMLKNEKYIGDSLLQKTYIADHLTKHKRKNKGELQRYYMTGSHEAIIDRDTFFAVQAEIERRSSLYKRLQNKNSNEFDGMIRCGKCGTAMNRKESGANAEYAKTSWQCRTYTKYGKDKCDVKRIPEDIIKEKCAEVLGLDAYDLSVFESKVASISIPDNGIITFTLKDGTEHNFTWEHRSRRDSWTEEMKTEASKKGMEIKARRNS